MSGSKSALVAMSLVCLLTAVRGEGWRVEGPDLATVNDVAISPAAPRVVYAATHGGGVWRSDDGGASWALPGDGMASRAVDWIEIDPSDPSRLWVGLDGARDAALWRSDDRGATWTPVQGTYDGGAIPMRPVGQRIAFAGPSTIFVPSTNQHYRSDDGGETWHGFRVPNGDAYAVAVDPEKASVVLAGGRGQTLNVSRSSDGGKTWTPTGEGLGQESVHQLFFDPHQGQRVWALAGTFGKIFRSDDGGQTFVELERSLGATKKIFGLQADPAHADVLWAATEVGLLRSKDAGASWEHADRGLGRYLVKRLAFHPDGSTLFAATGGTGVYVSRDGGASWTSSSEGLAAAWVEKLWGSTQTERVFVQTSVGLFRREPDGGWVEITEPFTDGDSAEIDGIIFDRELPHALYAFDASRYWKSPNEGRRFEQAEIEGPSMRDMMKGILDSPEFRSLVQDPKNPKVFFAGCWSSSSPGSAVFKTKDGGKKWKPAGQGLPSESVDSLQSEVSGTIFAVVDGEQVYRTRNGGESWSKADAGLPGERIHQLAIDPTTPSILYVATEEGLFGSQDEGSSWKRIGLDQATLDLDDVRAVVVEPKSGEIFAGTFHGVSVSDDHGATWTSLDDGMPNRDVRALGIAGSPARLWAGLGGGGLVSTELSPGVGR